MPYKLKGNTIYHKKGGRWSIKQRTHSPSNARKALRLLRGIEHGYEP